MFQWYSYEAGILFCSIDKGGKELTGQNTFFVLETFALLVGMRRAHRFVLVHKNFKYSLSKVDVKKVLKKVVGETRRKTKKKKRITTKYQPRVCSK